MLSFVPGGTLVVAYDVAMCRSQNNGIGVDDYGFHSIEDANKFDGDWACGGDGLDIDGSNEEINYPWK